MAIDLTDPNDPPINLGQATRFFASSRGGKPAHKSRVLRYILDGVRGRDGRRVRLEALKQGAQWVTNAAAIQAFCEALTPRLDDAPRPAPARRPGRRRADQASRRLDELGI